jgi:hypothetical protein
LRGGGRPDRKTLVMAEENTCRAEFVVVMTTKSKQK